MLPTPERTTWLNRENRVKKNELQKWLKKSLNMEIISEGLNTEKLLTEKNRANIKTKEELEWESITRKIAELDEVKFNRLKSKWSTHVNRKDKKNLSCSIGEKYYKQLIELKGNHKLKDTLEALIDHTHRIQTEQPLVGLEKVTTPILNSIQHPEFPKQVTTIISSSTLKSIQDNIEDIFKKLHLHTKEINSINASIPPYNRHGK